VQPADVAGSVTTIGAARNRQAPLRAGSSGRRIVSQALSSEPAQAWLQPPRGVRVCPDVVAIVE
jgi:hypothetical protein